MRGFTGAVAFLTRVPVARHPQDDVALARSVPWFPIVGGLVGLITGTLYWLAGEVLAPLPAAALAIGAQVVLTGALHEDGMADVADALGGSTVAERQRILHDPLHGTYGVLALVVSVVVRVALVASLAPANAAGALIAAHALGRGAAITLMRPGAGAAIPGVEATFTRHLAPGGRVAGMVVSAALAAIALGMVGEPIAIPAVVGLGAAVALVAGRWGRGLLGNLSGDLLGAVEQVVEIGVLVAVAAVAGAS